MYALYACHFMSSAAEPLLLGHDMYAVCAIVYS